MCEQCETNPVYELTNKRKFCEKCFCRFFEKKVFSTIRKYKMFSASDKVAVACSGGKDSMAVLNILHKIAKKARKEITALAVEEGIGQRRKLLKNVFID
jgi:tRNA(Ile)-lysidine synthase TilS/MesJ